MYEKLSKEKPTGGDGDRVRERIIYRTEKDDPEVIEKYEQ